MCWWLDIPYHCRKVKWYFQRARRGWADCDTWGLDGYLCAVMVPALEHLREFKGGHPIPRDAVIDPETGEATDAEYARWERDWNRSLDEMIAGFRAAHAVINGPPDRFFTARPPEEIAAEQKAADEEKHAYGKRWVSPFHYDMEGAQQWEAEQEAIRRKGFATFTESFYALWD